MSTVTVEPPETETSVAHAPGSPVLSPLLGEAWALSLVHLGLVAFGCVFFMYHNYVPLFHSDVWGHVAYGDWIIRHGRLPTEEPFVPLAAGVPVFDTAWLGQVILATTVRAGEPEWLCHLFAMTALTTYLTLTTTYFRQTHRIGVAVLAAVLVFVTGFSRHAIVRPEIFGSFCFAALIWLVVRADGRADRRPESFSGNQVERPFGWSVWIGVPVLFALWANLHGSFIVGFALLGCLVTGRAMEVLWETGDLIAVVRDRAFLSWSWLTELALLGTLCNPHGIDLLVQTVIFPSHPNLKDILEWYPLKLVSLEGPSMAFSWIMIGFLLRLSKARLTPADVLLLLVFNAAVCLRVRMIAWYGPVLMMVLAPHLADVVRQAATWRVWDSWHESTAFAFRRSFHWTLIAGFLMWCAYSFSPISRPVLGGKKRPDRQIFSRETPLGVTAYFREHPPQGLVAAPQWWGDWLVWDGPPGLEVMMTTNSVHVAPPAVWKDYLSIAGAAHGLEHRLNRYRINTLVVSKSQQTDLLGAVEKMPGWDVVFEDKFGLVAVRRASVRESVEVDDEETGG